MRDRILVVEDNKALAKLIAKKMQKNIDMDIVVANNLAQTMEIIDDSDDFFLAILDLNLPDAPNGEIVDYILSKNILVIILTASVIQKDEFTNKNIVDYVVKENISNINYLSDTINRLSNNRNYKAMIVSSSTQIRNEIKSILSSWLFKVFSAAHGEEAISYLNDNPDINLIITEYKMPVLDGFELVMNIRSLYDKNAKSIILIASNSNDAITAKFLKNGADDFIIKPFSKEELICRVNNCIGAMENRITMSKFSNIDYLSGAYNIQYFYIMIDEIYKVNKISSFPLAIFNIDDFKFINSIHGHLIGDDIIKKVARILLNDILDDGIVTRLGGDEFCVVLTKNLGFDKAVEKIVNLRAKIANYNVEFNSVQIKFTTSVGMTNGNLTQDIQEIIKIAKKALDIAKKSGKNRVEIL